MWIHYGGRPSNGRSELSLRIAVWLQVKVRGCGLGLRFIGCTPALFVTQKNATAAAVCGLWLAPLRLSLPMLTLQAIAI